jgi:outer membrane PBP1 activator LpoA protein
MLRFCTVLLLVLLASCASHPTRQQVLPELPTQANIPTAPAALSQALSSLPSAATQRQDYILAWANQYLVQARVDDAKTLLDILQPQQLTGSRRLHWVLLMAQVQLTQRQADTALALLDNDQLNIPELLSQAPLDVRTRMQLLRADALLLQGMLIKSLEQRVSVDPLLDETNRAYNEKMIWAILMHLPGNQLEQALNNSSADTLGWLQLAAIYRDPLANIETQSNRVDMWRQQWADHPAAKNPPEAIQVLQKATRYRPQKVAILLPLTGPLANAAGAIRDGLLTAYYQALSQQQSTAKLIFFDSHQGDIRTLYEQAVRQGAQLILGPLDKSRVAQLAGMGGFSIPVLAYNQTEISGHQPPRNFYEFGLAPEDEAAQIAEEAWHEGKHRAGILYPDSAWGQRVVKAFIADWQALGGVIISSQPYAKDGGKAVPKLLLTNESDAREKAVSRYTTLPIQFQERARQDLDFIFLVADADQGRQIKPLLNFHFAADLPVFALSYIYQGEPNPTKDRDLDGIRFLDIPWVLNNKGTLYQKAEKIWPDHHGVYQSLFALGLDSYRLIDHLPLLMAAPGMQVPGQTGALSLGNDRRIHRSLNWAIFRDGHVQVMPIVVSSFGQ